MDKLQTMQVFIEVAKQQSFSLASEVLGLSAPAASRAVAALEERLGVKLFNRTTRLVRLTESGARFLQDAKRILEDLEEAEAAAAGTYAKPTGTLVVTAPVLFGETYIMPIVTDYLAKHPGVSVKIILLDRVANLLEEDFDVAIRIGRLKDSSLYATTVGHVKKIICGSPEYFKRYGYPEKPEDLINHSVIFPAPFEYTNGWHFQINGNKELVRLTPRLRCNHNGAARKAALLGHGLTTLMSYQAAEDLKANRLQRVLTEFEEEPLPVNIIHLEGRRANAKTRCFIDLAAKKLRENPFLFLQ
ncbi:Transcriptional regulator [Hahella chejuensis KCTC 2396]|uniref:Transcriptional regulator n=1 Tax=Hahella chejuensis (strain KCTC 2396) TaxID=349521 RepID=Q2SGZ7_HAHCH|nr:LysR substrate-binding domain-containing protein [Hahella chejuensis]ABC30077.1 Transcriptional regulator [Hahella chejuensis KCTC 2396]